MLRTNDGQILSSKNTLYVDKFPLSQKEVFAITSANANQIESYIKLNPDNIENWEDTFRYLSYSDLKFDISFDDPSILEIYLKIELWFQANTLVLNYFIDNRKRLVNLIREFLNPDSNPHKSNFDRYSLSECSILEFGDFIYDTVSRERITVNIESQIKAAQNCTKRRAILDKLSRPLLNRGGLTELIPDYRNQEAIKFKYKDTLKKNIGSSSLPLGLSHQNTINLHLEVLDSCDQTCPGCFVKRKNKLNKDWSKELDAFLAPASYSEWNEVVVGPTDIFSATNFDEIFTQESWSSKSLSKFSAITFNSTLNFSDNEIKTKFQKIRTLFPQKQLEFFIIVDIHPFLSEDEVYMKWLKKKMELLEDSNIILTINTPELLFWRFESPGEIAYRWFNKNFKYTLSFFRSNNQKIISRYLRGMNQKCTSSTNILNYTYDRFFGGTTYTTLVYKAGEVYWSPCVVDFVFIEDPYFKISKFQNTEDLRKLKPTGQCLKCPEQMSCQAKGVMAVKNYLKEETCILPSDFSTLPLCH